MLTRCLLTKLCHYRSLHMPGPVDLPSQQRETVANSHIHLQTLTHQLCRNQAPYRNEQSWKVADEGVCNDVVPDWRAFPFMLLPEESDMYICMCFSSCPRLVHPDILLCAPVQHWAAAGEGNLSKWALQAQASVDTPTHMHTFTHVLSFGNLLLLCLFLQNFLADKKQQMLLNSAESIFTFVSKQWYFTSILNVCLHDW